MIENQDMREYVEVEFVTIGDAAEKLGQNQSTLRSWATQLEDIGVHYLERNNREDRLFYPNDLRIFKFFSDLKGEYGRKTTTGDLAGMLVELAKKGEFELRGKDEVHFVYDEDRATSLLKNEDIQELMKSKRVEEFIGGVMKQVKNEIREEIKEDIQKENEELYLKTKELLEEIDKRNIERDKKTTDYLNKIQQLNEEKKTGFWGRMFGK